MRYNFNTKPVKPTLFLSSPLYLVSVLFFLSLPFSSYALTASTTNFIHGNAPYLTFDGGQTRVTDMNNLLGISLSDGRTYSPNNNSATNPIVLPDINETLINVNMLVPTNANSIALNTLIGAPYNYWRDDDG